MKNGVFLNKIKCRYMMDTLKQLLDISSRLDYLEQSAEWIARETVHNDTAISQTGTLISVLTDDVRERIFNIVHELEQLFATRDLH
jgi:hypothetical protein